MPADHGRSITTWKRQPLSPISGSTDPANRVQAVITLHGNESQAARQAFQDLHRQYLPFTYALATRKSHPDDVEDIIQETWVGVWKRINDSLPIERFLSLLEVICRNKIADANERRFRRKRSGGEGEGPWLLSLDDPLSDGATEGDRWAETLEATDPLPETSVLHRERMEELWKLLNRLPDNWRLAIIYRFFNQMSVAETASVMNTTDDAIKKYVFRAVRRLREWMDGDLEFWLP